MSTVARHISPATIRATARHLRISKRRRSVLRFRTVWTARWARISDALAVVITASAGAVAFAVFGAGVWVYVTG